MESILINGGNNESFRFLNKLFVGHKLKLSESISKDYLPKLISGELTLDYKTLQNITRLLLVFGDLKNLTQIYIKFLEQDIVNLDELGFIAEYFYAIAN